MIYSTFTKVYFKIKFENIRVINYISRPIVATNYYCVMCIVQMLWQTCIYTYILATQIKYLKGIQIWLKKYNFTHLLVHFMIFVQQLCYNFILHTFNYSYNKCSIILCAGTVPLDDTLEFRGVKLHTVR